MRLKKPGFHLFFSFASCFCPPHVTPTWNTNAHLPLPPHYAAAAAAAKSLQSCLTLCNPIDGSPSGSPVPGILQARTLEWVAISFSNAWKWKNKVKSLSCVQLLATPWTAAHQAPPSLGFSRQEYWSHCLLLPHYARPHWTLWYSPKSAFSFTPQALVPNIQGH